jgi:hypothetical protein
LAITFSSVVQEVLDDDDGLGAAVLELVLELARRVQRVDVDRHVAGTQHRGDRHRVLEDVGHHDGDAVARLDATRLQPGAELARSNVEFAVGDRLAHADEGGARGILLHRFLEHRRHGLILRGVDLRWYAGGIVLDPGLFHCGLLRLVIVHYCIWFACRQQRQGPAEYSHPPLSARRYRKKGYRFAIPAGADAAPSAFVLYRTPHGTHPGFTFNPENAMKSSLQYLPTAVTLLLAAAALFHGPSISPTATTTSPTSRWSGACRISAT